MEFSTLNEHQEFCDAICGEHFLKKEIETEQLIQLMKTGLKSYPQHKNK